VKFAYDDGARKYETTKVFEGVIPNMERPFKETDSAWVREELGRYQAETPCEVCHGKRLKPESLAVRSSARTSPRCRACRSATRRRGSRNSSPC
jgi:excinuclease ABC subunit A